MTVRYTVVDADLLALRRLYQSRPEGRRAILREYVVGFLGACVGLATLSLVPWAVRRDVPLVAIPILLAAVFVVYTPFYLYLLRRADARCVATWRETAAGAHEMTLSDEGVHEVRPQGTMSHRWAFVQDICDRPEHLFILVGQNGTYTVPKRDLSVQDRASLPRVALEFWKASSAQAK
jgi:hypothetical protein